MQCYSRLACVVASCRYVESAWDHPSLYKNAKAFLAALDELLEQTLRPEFVYQHAWRQGDVLMIDNRAALHKAEHDFDQRPQVDVALFEAPPLARALYASTEIGDEIPENLYFAVAKVLAYVDHLRHSRHDEHTPRPDDLTIPEEYQGLFEERLDDDE